MKGPTKAAPPGWPRISSALYYDDAETAIDWLTTPEDAVNGEGEL